MNHGTPDISAGLISQSRLLLQTRMARKGTAKSPKTSFMFPQLHEQILKAASDEVGSAWFNNRDGNHTSICSYETHVMGRFTCTNDNCSNSGWASKKVAIVIRRYPRNGYNAVLFNQRCKICKQLGILSLDEKSYVDRVVYRLKKWAGVEVEPPQYTERIGLPHESELCEGCKRGCCKQGLVLQD